MKNNCKKASFTVEASLVLAFLCFLLAVFIQMILYLHDASVLTSAAYEAAQKGAALQYMEKEARKDYTRGEVWRLLENKRLACSVEKAEVQVSGTKVKVIVTGETGFFGGLSIQVEKEALLSNPVDHLRNYKKLEGLWKEKDP